MKKIFGTLAMALCLTAMVSCGGSDKKGGVDVVAQAKEKVAELNKLAAGTDTEAWEKASKEYWEWYEGLSTNDQAKMNEAGL
jgi:hypothetical protein